ncbi:MAG: hypothetical protein TREMPRED_004750 [Tremellales sp. Tagirdzhanova-0007]|nr:MAG: hypothetical protein TREMPRED_004750 [Tremellales sp. Tagirdzhanova-0007]
MNVLAEVALAQARLTPVQAGSSRQPLQDSATTNELLPTSETAKISTSVIDLGEHSELTKFMGETPKRERVYRFGEVNSLFFSSPYTDDFMTSNRNRDEVELIHGLPPSHPLADRHRNPNRPAKTIADYQEAAGRIVQCQPARPTSIYPHSVETQTTSIKPVSTTALAERILHGRTCHVRQSGSGSASEPSTQLRTTGDQPLNEQTPHPVSLCKVTSATVIPSLTLLSRNVSPPLPSSQAGHPFRGYDDEPHHNKRRRVEAEVVEELKHKQSRRDGAGQRLEDATAPKKDFGKKKSSEQIAEALKDVIQRLEEKTSECEKLKIELASNRNPRVE